MSSEILEHWYVMLQMFVHMNTGRHALLTFLQNSDPIWFPHWPTCNVMISLGILCQLRMNGLQHRYSGRAT